MNKFFTEDDFINLWLKMVDIHFDKISGTSSIKLGVNYPKPLVEVEEVDMDLP